MQRPPFLVVGQIFAPQKYPETWDIFDDTDKKWVKDKSIRCVHIDNADDEEMKMKIMREEKRRSGVRELWKK